MSEQSGRAAPARTRRARFDLVLRGYDREQVDRAVAGLEEAVSGLERDVAALTSELDVERGGRLRAGEAERSARAGFGPDIGSREGSSRVDVDALGARAERVLQAVEKEADEIRRLAGAEAARIVASAHAESERLRPHAERDRVEHDAHPLELAPETRLQLPRGEAGASRGPRRLVRVHTEVGAKLVLAEELPDPRPGGDGGRSPEVVGAGGAGPEGPAELTRAGLPLRRRRDGVAALDSATSGSPRPDAPVSSGDHDREGSTPEPDRWAGRDAVDDDVTSDTHAV